MKLKNKTFIHVLLLVTVMMLWFPQSAVAKRKVPELANRVNDNAGLLTKQQQQQLEQLLWDVENKTSSQVALLAIPSLEGDVIEDFSIRVAEKWNLGQKKFDNGVLMLLALKDREIRIEVGYGLEHIVTDAKSSYIIHEYMRKHFKRGDYFKGLHAGLTAISGLITKEFEITPEQLAQFKKNRRRAKGKHLPVGLIVFFIFIGMSMFKGRRSGSGRYHRSAPFIFFGGGGFGGRGGSGGGGFGGFSGGGGSFGGGGASGSW